VVGERQVSGRLVSLVQSVELQLWLNQSCIQCGLWKGRKASIGRCCGWTAKTKRMPVLLYG